MEIKLIKDKFTDKCFFLIHSEDLIAFSSEGIASALNITVEQYFDTLAKEVIRHGNISIKSSNKIFLSKGISNEVYVERFKEAFAPQLTLLALEIGK